LGSPSPRQHCNLPMIDSRVIAGTWLVGTRRYAWRKRWLLVRSDLVNDETVTDTTVRLHNGAVQRARGDDVKKIRRECGRMRTTASSRTRTQGQHSLWLLPMT
jgi:hypothetical protein